MEAARISESVGKGISRDKLLETAAELGIPAEAVAQAEANLAKQTAEVNQLQNESVLRAEYASEIRRLQRVTWSGWLTTSAICLGIDLFISKFQISELSWSLWVAGIYGLFCIKDFVLWLVGKPERDEAGFRRWQARRDHVLTRLASVGMTIPQLDLLLESRIEAGAEDAADLVRTLQAKTGLNDEDARLAVKNFIQRNPEIASEYELNHD